MITSFVLHLVATVAQWVLSLFPTWLRPAWVASLITTVTGFFANVGDLSYIVPLDTIVLCAAALVLAWVAASSIKVTRLIASYIIPGWGSAS